MQHNNQTIGCLFDLDGVLVDTAVYHYQAWKDLANSLGFDFTEAQNEQLKGISRVRSLELILQWGGVEKTAAEQEALATTKNDAYVKMISQMTANEVLPGAAKLLQDLKAAGIKIALGSASKNSGLILERTGLAPLFDLIVDGNHVTSSKPDPEVFLKGAEGLGIAPERSVVFEDAVAGVQAARAGHMKVVGVGDAETLKEADVVVRDLSAITVEEIIALINKKA